MSDIQYTRWRGDERFPAVVCLHGFMGNGQDFQIVADNFQNHPTLIAPNLPDYSKAPTHNNHTWDSMLEDLNRFIQEEVGNEPCMLLGYSMGGRIALQYALNYQHRLSGLILIGATPGIEDEIERAQRLKADEELATLILGQPINSFLESWFNNPILKTQNQIAEPYLTRMREIRKRHNPKALAYYLNTLGTGTMDGAWDLLHTLKLPTLLVSGEKDEKFTGIAQALVKKIHDCHHTIIQNAAHAACYEKPKEFVQSLVTFLGKHPVR